MGTSRDTERHESYAAGLKEMTERKRAAIGIGIE